MLYDCLVLGGGVVGSSCVRFLSKYDMKLALIEKESDFCEGTSKANSGIVHSGYDPVENTLKARFNIRGSKIIRELAPILDIDLVNNGAFVLSQKKDDEKLKLLYKRGVNNGVEELRIVSQSELRELEPNINESIQEALYLPTSSIVCPFSLTIAMAENAVQNGCEVYLSHKVLNILKEDDYYLVICDKRSFKTKTIINACGLYSDEINNLVSDEKVKITPRVGQYVLLDKSEGDKLKATLFQLPNEKGKGVLVTPTVHKNILVGPNAIDLDDKENTATDKESLDYVMAKAKESLPSLSWSKIITSFSGLRAHYLDDFTINEAKPLFFNALGIESPGLSSAPAIGEYLASIIAKRLDLKEKKEFIYKRAGIIKANTLSNEERSELIKKNPLYGNIICRCEEISEAEIVEAIKRGATTMDGVKRRVRAMMGRCQGGFCTSSIVEIIAREKAINKNQVRKNSKGSEVLL